MKDLEKEYVKELEQGYVQIMEIFRTHTNNDISMADKIYQIVKEIWKRI